MKKVVSIVSAIIMLFTFSCVSYAADAVYTIKLSDDIAGATYKDIDRLVVSCSDNIVPDTFLREDPVQINDIAGRVITDGVKAGRTYTISYIFTGKDGASLPEKLDSDSLKITAGKGVSVFWSGITTSDDLHGNVHYSLSVNTTVTVKGSFIQNIFGKLADFLLRLTSWSPY